ncbi:hypothetical protein Tco_1069618 [Tanacetum coccineum]|uniref:Uncharacterized protein n=1 Tax=Tanacetum coccineum TaxID=301880 RepID=A0ABQ5HJ23_9ASTR
MVLQERGCESLPILTEMNPRDHVNSISTIVEADTTPVCRIGSTRYTVLAQQNSKLIFKPRQATVPFPSRLYDDFMCERKGSYGLKDLDAYSIRTTLRNDSLPKKEKDPGSFTLPYYINIVCFEKALTHLGASVSVMPLSTYLNLGLGELAHTKLTVELTDRILKHPKGIAKNVLVGIELRRNQVDDLEPTIEEGKVVNNPMIDIAKARSDFIGGLYDYPSECDFDRRIYIACAYNLSCRKENIDPYLDEGMGDVIVGEPFCKASCVEAKRFDGIITIHDGDNSVTYQMVRENLRFKHLTNKKCNKISPLLKVNKQDKMNRISHSYQKLKGFYKGVVILGPEFIRDAKVEQWFTRGHISVQGME